MPESAIARESHVVLPTLAGPEIGVASTKAFTTQLTVLLAAAIAAGRARGVLSRGRRGAAGQRPDRAAGACQRGAEHGGRSIARIAEDILAEARDVLYLGRGSSFPIALEGALKLKEISYIHAEGYAGGEMKHGPIALIDEAVPVVVVAPTDAIFDKIASNFEQVKARGGKLVLLSDAAGIARLGAPGRGGDHAADGRSGGGADPLHRAGAAARLLHGRRQGHRRRPAAQPRQERDGRVIIGALPHPNGIIRTGRRQFCCVCPVTVHWR